MKRDYRICLNDILQAFSNARQFLEGLSWETVKVRIPDLEPLIKDVLSDLEQE
jgi:uncharacterized protein with HEPN domain